MSTKVAGRRLAMVHGSVTVIAQVALEKGSQYLLEVDVKIYSDRRVNS